MGIVKVLTTISRLIVLGEERSRKQASLGRATRAHSFSSTPLKVSSIWLAVPTVLAPPNRFFQPHLHISPVV